MKSKPWWSNNTHFTILLVIFLSKTQSLKGNFVGVFPEEMSISISSLSTEDSPHPITSSKQEENQKKTSSFYAGTKTSTFFLQMPELQVLKSCHQDLSPIINSITSHLLVLRLLASHQDLHQLHCSQF